MLVALGDAGVDAVDLDSRNHGRTFRMLAIDFDRSGESFETSVRYAEETIRDALPVALSQTELRDGVQFNLYHKWAGGTRDFLTERYGQPGAWMDDAVSRLKSRLRSTDDHYTREAAEEAWLAALQVWDIVWKYFCNRVRVEQPEVVPWMCRVNSFV